MSEKPDLGPSIGAVFGAEIIVVLLIFIIAAAAVRYEAIGAAIFNFLDFQ